MVTAAGSAGGHLHGICQDLTDVRRAEEARAEAVERFRSVFERAPVGMALLARDGRFTLANEAMAEFLGRPGGALLGVHASRTSPIPTTCARRARRCGGWWRASCRSGTPRSATCGRAARSAGAPCGRCSCATPTAGPSCLALVRDVTEQRLAERRRSALHGVARIMAGGAPLSEALPALVETVVRELDWERGSAVAARRSRASCAAWPRGRPAARRREPPELPAEPTATGAGIVIPIVSGADALGLLELACAGPERLGDDLARLRGRARVQIGEFLVRKRAEELLLHQALHDPLTGLPNRVLFFDRLDHAIRRLQREHAPLAVLFVDFDGFKAVNDRFGHAGGDEVLKRAADRVSAALRAEDTVARFGGDELVVLSEHVAGAAGGALIAERILEQLRAPIDIDGEQVTLSASIGICVAPIEGAHRDELLRAADAAMYQAKAAGPGRYVIAE